MNKMDGLMYVPTSAMDRLILPSWPSTVKLDGFEMLQVNRWGQIYVCQQLQIPVPGPDEILVEIIVASVCAADGRVFRGEKEIPGGLRGGTSGHEGFGRVVALGFGVSPDLLGQYVVILPHIWPPDHDQTCPEPPEERRGVRCCLHSNHLGLLGKESRGTFAQYIRLPVENVVCIPEEYIQTVASLGQNLPPGYVFSLVEPIHCCLSGLRRVQRESIRSFHKPLVPGRALVIGSGPMGALNAFVLKLHGYEVSVCDKDIRRVRLVLDRLPGCLAQVWDPGRGPEGFDFVMTTAPDIESVYTAIQVVRPDGIVFLFSGFNKIQQEEAEKRGDLPFDAIHRAGILIPWRTGGKDYKMIGTTGYEHNEALSAVKFVAKNYLALSRLVTGAIDNLDSPVIRALLPGASPILCKGPALIEILRGEEYIRNHLMNHLKMVVLPWATKEQ